jgi:hypothetical protein
MKLASFQGANALIITQSNHGADQGNCAFDFGWKGPGTQLTDKLYAPCDGSVYTHIVKPDGDSYFDFSSLDYGPDKNFFIRFVHDTPIRKGCFKKGELLGQWNGKTPEPHHHIALHMADGWHWIFDAIDRGTQLYFWNWGNTNNKWAQWSTYTTDIQLPPVIPVPPIITCEEKLSLANVQIAKLQTDLGIANTQLAAAQAELKRYIPKTIYEKI